MVVNYRGDRYRTDQALVCYWNFYVDWFSFFWIDLVANTRVVKKTMKKKNRDRRRKQKLKRKEEFKRQREL